MTAPRQFHVRIAGEVLSHAAICPRCGRSRPYDRQRIADRSIRDAYDAGLKHQRTTERCECPDLCECAHAA